jgi:hypothetical protein
MPCRRWIGSATSCGSCNAPFGRRSEKLDPEQLLLAIEDIEQTLAGDEAAEDRKDPAGARKRADKRRADRGALPAHLPHIDVTIAPRRYQLPLLPRADACDRRGDVEAARRRPPQFRVIVTHRPKYACRACTDGVVQAPAVERLIKGGGRWSPMCSSPNMPGICRSIGRPRYCLRRASISSARCLRSGWAMRPQSFILLWLRLREIILIAGKIAVDETTAPVLDPGRGRTKKGFFWAIARRRGGCRSSVKMAVFTPNP